MKRKTLRHRVATYGRRFEVQKDVGPGLAQHAGRFETANAAYRAAAAMEGLTLAAYLAACERECIAPLDLTD